MNTVRSPVIQETGILKHLCVLLLTPMLADAGVVYDVAIRSVGPTNLAVSAPESSAVGAVVTHYFVQDGRVRVGGPNAKIIYVFDDRTMDVIDNTTHTVHVLAHATLGQVAAHYAEAVKQLENAAATAPPDSRAEAEQKAVDMKAASDRLLQRVARDYRVTVRFESVDGHACRIWEERERDAKRMELCVAPVGAVPGGAEILSGMKTLSRFRQGADFAFGVELGLSEWWPDFSTLGGIPLLVREYKYDSVVSEVMLTGMRQDTLSASIFAMPDGYRVLNGPDYAMWYVR
jgi:hypothetical protein